MTRTLPASDDGVPHLPQNCNSWVVTAPDGRVFELYVIDNVRKAVREGWKAETAVDYLVRLNGAKP